MRYKWRLGYISFQNYADAALHLPPTTPYAGVYGERLNPRQIDAKYCLSTDTIGNLKTEVYQMEARHKKFADELKHSQDEPDHETASTRLTFQL